VPHRLLRVGQTAEWSPFEKRLTSLLTRFREDTLTVSMTHPREWRGVRIALTRAERRERRSAADPSLRRLIAQLVDARHRVAMTQEQIAWKLGTKKSAISRLESGFLHRPNLTTIENYALVVGCRIDVVLRPLP